MSAYNPYWWGNPHTTYVGDPIPLAKYRRQLHSERNERVGKVPRKLKKKLKRLSHSPLNHH